MSVKEMCAKFNKVVPKSFYDNDLPDIKSEQERRDYEVNESTKEEKIINPPELNVVSQFEHKVNILINNKPWRTGSTKYIKLKLELDMLITALCINERTNKEGEKEERKRLRQELDRVIQEMYNLEYGTG